MKRVKDIIKIMEEFAPINLKEDFDNVGLMVGDKEKEVKKVLLSLDCTLEVIEEAKKQSHASQHANVAVHLDAFLLVHEVAEFGSCHSADDAEQHSERQGASDDAAN